MELEVFCLWVLIIIRCSEALLCCITSGAVSQWWSVSGITSCSPVPVSSSIHPSSNFTSVLSSSSSACVASVMQDLQPPFPPAKYVQLVCSGSYPNSSCSSGAEHAGFLPLPQGCLCLSAHAAPCVVLHKGKVMPALMVQVGLMLQKMYQLAQDCFIY